MGDGSWPWPDLTLGAIYFSVNGDEAWLENDIDYSLISIPLDVDRIHGNGSPINYSTHIVSTPEPGLLLTLLGSFWCWRFLLTKGGNKQKVSKCIQWIDDANWAIVLTVCQVF